MNDDCSMFVLGQNQTCEWIKAACYSSILSRPNADDIGYPLGARTMPPHLHDRADPDIPPRALRPRAHEPGLVGDLVCPGPSPPGSSEGTGRIVASGHGPAPSGRPKIRGHG